MFLFTPSFSNLTFGAESITVVISVIPNVRIPQGRRFYAIVVTRRRIRWRNRYFRIFFGVDDVTFIKALDDDISVLLISPTIYLSVVLGMLIRCVHEACGNREVIDRKTISTSGHSYETAQAFPGRYLVASPRGLVQQATRLEMRNFTIMNCLSRLVRHRALSSLLTGSGNPSPS
ncbi:uncharacterized protein SCHCODRAFT_02690693 [Schizophyllum commune H4-8]|nr:uncharacterized protein SCHCODRAFT_02690693 [Schizophyllum commune H4-8]KAI5890778.1 hypothetical protein SCHCODRAFT_02690693 [Schizophyllum commune H4-8]